MYNTKEQLLNIIDVQLDILRTSRFELMKRGLIGSEEAILLFNDELDLENFKLEVLKGELLTFEK